MSTLYLAAVVLLSPPAADSSSTETAAAVLSPKELREAFRDAVRTSYQSEPGEAVPKLVDVYKALQRDKQLSNTERTELKRRLRSRMITMGDKIVENERRALKKRQQEEAKAKRSSPASQSAQSASSTANSKADSSSTASEGAAGGGGEDDADELIELIRTVIRPESWDVNGGPGTIYYYRPAMALVVTQTQEVHWLIGGLSGALRK